MTSRTPLLLLTATLLVASRIDAQATLGPRGLQVSTGVPDRTAAERWIVHWRAPSCERSGLRAALAQGRSPEAIQTLVGDLERGVATAHAAFRARLAELGGRVLRDYWLVDATAVEAPAAVLAELRAFPGVERLERDELVRPQILRATNAQNHDADAVQALGYRGQGVTVAVLDTGQDESSGQLGRPHRLYYADGNLQVASGGIGNSRLIVNRQLGQMQPDDTHGHGTAMASVVAGGKWNGSATSDHGHAPRAGIAGYAIADDSQGYSYLSTMVAAWQSIVMDKPSLGIVAAVNAYSGSPDPLNVAQQALDAAADLADILITVPAGNAGTSGTSASQGACNGLAVGGVYPDTHQVASYSSRGPLYDGRSYPDLAGCAVATVMAMVDNETSEYTATGSSIASCQACGAAALIRSADPALTALETKAILLASALDVASQNPGYDRNAFGMGLVHDRRALGLAQSTFQHGRGSIDSSSPVWSRTISVRQGASYAAAITWMRHNPAAASWSNLDLFVLDGTTVVASSTSQLNLYEMVRFTATRDGYYTLIASASALAGQSEQFGYAETSEHDTAADYVTLWSATGTPGKPKCTLSGLSAPVLGGTMTLSAGASGFDWAALIISGRQGGLLNLPLGTAQLAIYVDLSAPYLALMQPVSQLGKATFSVPVPNAPSLVGYDLALQAVSASLTAPDYCASALVIANPGLAQDKGNVVCPGVALLPVFPGGINGKYASITDGKGGWIATSIVCNDDAKKTKRYKFKMKGYALWCMQLDLDTNAGNGFAKKVCTDTKGKAEFEIDLKPGECLYFYDNSNPPAKIAALSIEVTTLP